MFYFIYGDSPLQIKYEEVLKELLNKNEGIDIKYFDASQKEEELFLENISINSIFSIPEILVLKRVENISKLDKFLEIVEKYDLSQKKIILLYEEKIDEYGRTTNEVSKKILGILEKIGKSLSARKKDEKKSLEFYVSRELEINDTEAKKLLDIIGDDFYKVKNEVEKIKNFLNESEYNLERIKPILILSKEQTLKNEIEKFLETLEPKSLIEYLQDEKEYFYTLYILSEELQVMLKLISLQKIGVFKAGVPYNYFKDNIYNEIKKYFKNNRGYMKEYPIYLKIKNINRYSEKFLLDQIEEILKTEYDIKNGKIQESIGVEKYILQFTKEKR